MTSSQMRASNDSSSQSAARSLLSRLKSPLSSKTRNYTEFYIQSDDPHRQYNPGDVISGTVIIKVVKPLRITHLVVSLHGYAQVFKTPNAPGDAFKSYSTTLGSGTGKRTGGYFGNGFCSLFEDEVVLCGEGRLSEGVYHFNFELEFPSKSMPSSIDFERGTIAYMLTATLTRPTTILPTTSCHAPIFLQETVDIASLPLPKPRIISLEPVSKRTRTKTRKKRPMMIIADGVRPTPNGPDGSLAASALDGSSHLDDDALRSPSPSDVSFESQLSSGNASGTEYGVRSVNTEAISFQHGSRTISRGKTITACIDMLRGGFLRGDQIPIKVVVNHTKHVRSLRGIIITLFRQARVDMHPELPLAPNSKGDKTKSEDYYPKSRTGLGGLSLSSAGSSHTFRKDLCQSFAPLFVDPRTLTAEIKCSVRVPDDAFPTISNVPGAMISFKYYVEVVIDIQGKLAGLDRLVTQTGIVNISSAAGGSNSATQGDATGSTFSTWGGNFLDTDQIRREKGVVSALFEVTVGTRDSDRNGKQRCQQKPLSDGQTDNESQSVIDNQYGEGHGYDHNYHESDPNGQYHDHNYDQAYYNVPEYDQQNAASSTPYYVPPAHSENEQLSEKEQLRRAEARLLPSGPSAEEGSSSTSHTIPLGIPPSAPDLRENHEVDPPSFSTPSSSAAPSYQRQYSVASREASSAQGSSHQPSFGNTRTTSGDVIRVSTPNSYQTIKGNASKPASPPDHEDNPSKPLPPLPSMSPMGIFGQTPEYYFASGSHVLPTDDKQELRRRRLELERSTPPGEHYGDEIRLTQPPLAPLTNGMRDMRLAPSAPVLDEDDEDLVSAVRRGHGGPRSESGNGRASEALPEYRK